MDDEDEVTEIVRLGGGVEILQTGLDLAMMRARSAYIAGRIDVEEFEAEVERLLRKRAALRR